MQFGKVPIILIMYFKKNKAIGHHTYFGCDVITSLIIHNVPCCVKRPCISTSIDSLRPLFITSPSNLWSGHPVILFPLSEMSLGVYNFCTLYPWITTSL
jgi:hypothetical protein